MSHLERVTECEHGLGKLEWTVRQAHLAADGCPGGSRVRVEPGALVELMAEAMAVADSFDLPSAGHPWWNMREVDRNEFQRLARAAVDAALLAGLVALESITEEAGDDDI